MQKTFRKQKKMYKKSLELNPDNKNAIDILKSLSNTK
jgi:hypothetical protein